MSMLDIPGRAFLDTSVVNFWLDYGAQISGEASIPDRLTNEEIADIKALNRINLTGQRASWQLAISPHTYQEVMNTTNPSRRHYLETWFFEIWGYWQGIIRENNDLPTFNEAESVRIDILSSGILEVLPDVEDRILLLDAIVYNSDLFCTRDRSTIIKYRDVLKPLSILILTPSEWWEHIEPYAYLWW